jgi:hypothetical protein
VSGGKKAGEKERVKKRHAVNVNKYHKKVVVRTIHQGVWEEYRTGSKAICDQAEAGDTTVVAYPNTF